MKLNTGIYSISDGDTVLYVGGASNMRERFGNHLWRLEKGNHPNPTLREAFSRLGRAGLLFTRLLYCAKKDLRLYEQLVMDALKPIGNLCPTAGSPLGLKQSAATKEKKRQALQGRAPSAATMEGWRQWHASKKKES